MLSTFLVYNNVQITVQKLIDSTFHTDAQIFST